MGPEQLPQQPNSDSSLAAELSALSARVETLERELLQLRTQIPQQAPAKPRRPTSPAPDSTSATPPPKPSTSLEDRIGSQLFSRIGIIALLIATTLFLKWAIDNHWIGPIGRILAGLVAGTVVILWSERFRRNGFSAFSYALKAIGSGALYLSLWAAFQLYHLLPASIALAAMVLITAWNAFMAWSQSSELLAAYALAGAFATPLLLSTGGNYEVFLFTYLLTIDLATVALVYLKPWPRLLLGAFPATVAFFVAWYIAWFNTSSTQDPIAVTILFIVLFFTTFIAPSLRSQTAQQSSITEILLPLANAIFAALALYFVLEDSGHHDLLPWIAILFAVIYLALMRLPQPRVTSAVHLALAVTFLTIAIPLKASGRWITIGWLAEGVALLWVSARLSTPTADAPTPDAPSADAPSADIHRTLRRLALAALALGFCGLLIQPLWLYPPIAEAFLNSRFGTALFGIVSLAASAGIALHARQYGDKASPSWLSIAAASIIALNLTAVLACVRELNSAWRLSSVSSEPDLQKALAISAFLMLYGALLLAVGFWKRTAFIRWQALILLVFTIGKTFLYDLRNLSQGYRVLSFLGLGALLMAVSFAYQKDWLALRDPQPSGGSHAAPREGANP
jgi:uncharacterized membrane protein